MILKKIKFSKSDSNVFIRGVTNAKRQSGKEKVAHQPTNGRIKGNYSSAVTDRKRFSLCYFLHFVKVLQR